MASENGNTSSANPKTQHPSRVRTLNRLSFSKPKSRMLEYNYVPAITNNVAILEENDDIQSSSKNFSTDEEDEERDEEEELEEDGSDHGRKVC